MEAATDIYRQFMSSVAATSRSALASLGVIEHLNGKGELNGKIAPG